MARQMHFWCAWMDPNFKSSWMDPNVDSKANAYRKLQRRARRSSSMRSSGGCLHYIADAI
jgi:hypothetical protein